MFKRKTQSGKIRFVLVLILFLVSIPQAFADDPQINSFQVDITAYQNRGNHAQAVVTARRYVSYTEQQYGVVHKNTVRAVHILGLSYFSNGQYSEAERFLRQALLTHEKIVGRNHKDLIPHLTALATVNNALIRFGEADRYTKRADKIADQ